MIDAGQQSQEYRRRIRYTPLIVLLIAVAVVLIALNRPLVRGDSIAYLVWLDSIALDGDINFSNQTDKFGDALTYQVLFFDETEKYVNLFPFGASILQIPFYLIGDALAQQDLLNANPDYFRQMQGVTQPYSYAVMVGTNVMTLFTLAFAWRMIAPTTGNWIAAGVCWLLFIGTPLAFYSSVNPFNSHSSGAFMATFFLYCLIKCTDIYKLSWSTDPVSNRSHTSAGWWMLLGLTAAMMAQVRWQLLLIAIPAWAVILYQQRMRGLGIATTVAFFVMLPLPFAWQELFGKWLHSPNDTVGKAFMLDAPIYLPDVVGMWLSHSPIVILSLVGLPFLWRRYRSLALVAGLAILSQILMSAWITDWHGSQAYGLRRMTELYPFYVVTAGAFLTWFLQGTRNRRSTATAASTPGDTGDTRETVEVTVHLADRPIAKWRKGVVIAGFVVMTLYTALYMASFFSYTWTNPYERYSDTPDAMISYFVQQPHNLQILHEVWYTHLGPYSWDMPGP